MLHHEGQVDGLSFGHVRPGGHKCAARFVQHGCFRLVGIAVRSVAQAFGGSLHGGFEGAVRLVVVGRVQQGLAGREHVCVGRILPVGIFHLCHGIVQVEDGRLEFFHGVFIGHLAGCGQCFLQCGFHLCRGVVFQHALSFFYQTCQFFGIAFHAFSQVFQTEVVKHDPVVQGIGAQSEAQVAVKDSYFHAIAFMVAVFLEELSDCGQIRPGNGIGIGSCGEVVGIHPYLVVFGSSHLCTDTILPLWQAGHCLVQVEGGVPEFRAARPEFGITTFSGVAFNRPSLGVARVKRRVGQQVGDVYAFPFDDGWPCSHKVAARFVQCCGFRGIDVAVRGVGYPFGRSLHGGFKGAARFIVGRGVQHGLANGQHVAVCRIQRVGGFHQFHGIAQAGDSFLVGFHPAFGSQRAGSGQRFVQPCLHEHRCVVVLHVVGFFCQARHFFGIHLHGFAEELQAEVVEHNPGVQGRGAHAEAQFAVEDEDFHAGAVCLAVGSETVACPGQVVRAFDQLPGGVGREVVGIELHVAWNGGRELCADAVEPVTQSCHRLVQVEGAVPVLDGSGSVFGIIGFAGISFLCPPVGVGGIEGGVGQQFGHVDAFSFNQCWACGNEGLPRFVQHGGFIAIDKGVFRSGHPFGRSLHGGLKGAARFVVGRDVEQVLAFGEHFEVCRI